MMMKVYLNSSSEFKEEVDDCKTVEHVKTKEPEIDDFVLV
jgi:hypothetical protein